MPRRGQYEDIAGQRFGRLVATQRISDFGRSKWLCVCDCGNTKVATISNLRNGTTQSCGCYMVDRVSQSHTKHGGCKSGVDKRLYRVWKSMRQRCYLKSNYGYPRYGGRGIRVCKEWEDFGVFRAWALSNGYDITAERGKTTLDRIDNDGDYCPENCRFANSIVQANNKGINKRNVLIEYHGETKFLSEWARQFGLCYETLIGRLKRGWEVEKIFSAPTRNIKEGVNKR